MQQVWYLPQQVCYNFEYASRPSGNICGHLERPVYSKKMCQRCYMRHWRRQRRRRAQLPVLVPVDVVPNTAPVIISELSTPNYDVLLTRPGVHQHPHTPPWVPVHPLTSTKTAAPQIVPPKSIQAIDTTNIATSQQQPPSHEFDPDNLLGIKWD